MLNKQKGNMYGFVTHTWNAIKGICIHNCDYCYMKVFPQKPLHLSEKEFKDNLGKDNYIFVGSSTDMFANNVPKEWILRVLDYCKMFNNKYLFQTKNPIRFLEFIEFFPEKTILAITLETNRQTSVINCPQPADRAYTFSNILFSRFDKMVTIEPIIDFDVPHFIKLIQEIRPKYVNIGADSKNHNLPEPSEFKIKLLIEELKKFTNITKKENLSRII